MKKCHIYESPVGTLVLSCTEHGLRRLAFLGSEGCVQEEVYQEDARADAHMEQVCKWLDVYFSGQCPTFMPVLDIEGTPFQLAVWKLLLEIPYGDTRSYGWMAAEIVRRFNKPRMSAQAIGGAVGKNPIAIIIPCHRVIGACGQLTGYAWGLEKKAALLILEGCDTYKE